MEQNKYFSFSRLTALFKKDFTEQRRTILITAAALFGALLIIFIIASAFNDSTWYSPGAAGADSHYGITQQQNTTMDIFFFLILMIGGLIISSKMFAESHKKIENHDWFMLPASTLEKFAARLIASSIVYVIAAVIFMLLLSVTAGSITALLFNDKLLIFNPLKRSNLLTAASYLVSQSLFLLGSAYFKKNHFIKTILTMVIAGIVFFLFALLMIRFFFAPYIEAFDGSFNNFGIFSGFHHYDADNWLLAPIIPPFIRVSLKVLYWVVMAPLFWIITYIRLREVEVKDGI
jgi:hypothetical protein